ncbi:uncharacterized protein PHACADRAFT_51453, partial [Phanerochaete carnosa HHB-10118-sp]
IHRTIDPKAHARYLLNYHDRRFQEDEYFLFIVFNYEQIASSSQSGHVLVEQQKVSDLAEKILRMDLDVL